MYSIDCNEQGKTEGRRITRTAAILSKKRTIWNALELNPGFRGEALASKSLKCNTGLSLYIHCKIVLEKDMQSAHHTRPSSRSKLAWDTYQQTFKYEWWAVLTQSMTHVFYAAVPFIVLSALQQQVSAVVFSHPRAVRIKQ